MRSTSRAIYAGLLDGHVYRSLTGTSNRQEADHGLPGRGSINALVVTPDGSTIYAGTGSGTDDSGFSIGEGSGVYVSMDGGMSWNDDNGDNPNLRHSDIVGLALDSARNQDLYAVTYNGEFYTSSDAGRHWDAAALPIDTLIMTFAVSPLDPALMLIGTQFGGIFRSSDGGIHWHKSNLSTDNVVSSVSFSPRSATVAYAATVEGIYQTIDGGTSWIRDRRGISDHTQFLSIAVDPTNPARVVAGSSGDEFYRSRDGGITWSSQGFGTRTNGIYTLLFDPAQTGVVLAGPEAGSPIYRSDDSGGHWFGYVTVFGAEDVILALAAAAPPALPTDPVVAPSGNAQGVRYFPQTHHTVSGPFLAFYNTDNGLKIFGLPLTETFSAGGHIVQYFERSRLVLTNGRVSITPLGSQLTAGRHLPPIGAGDLPSGGQYFSQTRHTISGKFLTFWQSHQGATFLDYPISQPLYEQNGDGTGRTYLVQYFQNARLEYHPELSGTSSLVTLGLLGKEALQKRGWL